MACEVTITISDGSGDPVEITIGSLATGYEIGKAEIPDGHEVVRFANGSARRIHWWEKRQLTITGAGPASPEALWTLDLTAASWTVTLPGFADGSADEVWTVIPARPDHRRSRLAPGGHSWTLTLVEA
jgi:hypothetical protein